MSGGRGWSRCEEDEDGRLCPRWLHILPSFVFSLSLSSLLRGRDRGSGGWVEEIESLRAAENSINCGLGGVYLSIWLGRAGVYPEGK